MKPHHPKITPATVKAGLIPYKLIRSRTLHAKNLAEAEKIRKKRKFQCHECGHMRLGRHASGCSQS